MIARRLMLAAAAGLMSPPAVRAANDAAAAPLTAQDRSDVGRIEAYLNGIRSLKARFLQVASDGGLSQGTVWLQRPGRMRFQYDPPAPFLLLAAHGVLTFNDSALQQTTNIPIGRTPLGILLAEKVTLSGAVTITALQRLPGQIQLTLIRTDDAGDGSLTLILSDPPLQLRQWTVLDAQRRSTRVTLSNIQLGLSFNPQLFEHTFMPPSDLASPG